MTERRPPVLPLPGTAIPTIADAGLKVGTDFQRFVAAIEADRGVDLRFVHAPAQIRRVRALERGVNCFGVEGSRAEAQFHGGEYQMQAAETVILHDTIFSSRTTTLCAINRGFYGPSIRNFFLVGPTLASMVKLDPLYVLDAADQPRFSEEVSALEYIDSVAVPVCGTGFHNYGHFLYDGLPTVFMLMSALREGTAEIIGPPLRPWQKSILELLGVGHRYRTMQRPAVFRKVVATSMLSLHVPYPTRFVRPVFDTLRFRIGGPATAPSRRIFISRRNDSTRRLLVNRDQVEASFRAAGFEIVEAETLSVPEQIRLFSAATVVAGKSGAGLANVAFCDPGTRVLEIQPSGFFEGWTRTASMLMALEWHVCFAETLPQSGEDKAGPLKFVVDPGELRSAIDRVSAP